MDLLFLAQTIKTFGGNSHGEKCHFPFTYEGKVYNSCINREHKAADNSTSSVKFCATTGNYDLDQKWVYMG